MSYVICVAMENQAIIMGDGRAINGKQIVTESYKKVLCLTPNIIIGFTGISATCQAAIAYIRKKPMISSIGIAKSLQDYADNPSHPCRDKCSFVIADKDVSGKIHISTYHMESNIIVVRNPNADETVLVSLSSDEVDGYEILRRNMLSQSGNILTNMCSAILEVAQLDFSVNGNISWEILK